MPLKEQIEQLDISVLDSLVEHAFIENKGKTCDNHNCEACTFRKKLDKSKLKEFLIDQRLFLLMLAGEVTPDDLFLSGFMYAIQYYEVKKMEELFPTG